MEGPEEPDLQLGVGRDRPTRPCPGRPLRAVERLLAAGVHHVDVAVRTQRVRGGDAHAPLLERHGDGGDLVPAPHVALQVDALDGAERRTGRGVRAAGEERDEEGESSHAESPNHCRPCAHGLIVACRDRGPRAAQGVQGPPAPAGPGRVDPLPLPAPLRGGEGRRRHLLLGRPGRAGRVPRPERGGQDHHAEGPLRAPPPQRRRGAGGRLRPGAARERLPQVHHPGDGAEAAAALGPAPVRDLRPEPGHLRDPAPGVRGPHPRAGRAARPRRRGRQADAAALPRASG